LQPSLSLDRDITSDAFVTKINPSGSALVYSTYLGGKNGDAAKAIAVDSAEGVYITGATNSKDFPTVNRYTWSPDFPMAHALRDKYKRGTPAAFVTKLNAAGSGLVYST
jgi:hypothetical protein